MLRSAAGLGPPPFLLPCSTFPSPSRCCRSATRIEEQGWWRRAVAAEMVLCVLVKGEMDSPGAAATTLRALPWKVVLPQSWVTSGSAIGVSR